MVETIPNTSVIKISIKKSILPIEIYIVSAWISKKKVKSTHTMLNRVFQK